MKKKIANFINKILPISIPIFWNIRFWIRSCSEADPLDDLGLLWKSIRITIENKETNKVYIVFKKGTCK